MKIFGNIHGKCLGISDHLRGYYRRFSCNGILSHIIYHSNQSNGFICNEWFQNLQQKWVLLQSITGEFSIHDQSFCRHQHRWSLHGVTRKLDLDQTSMAHKHTKRHKCDKTHFSVRPRDLLHLSQINSELYVAVMFVWVCLCRFLWQIILLTYMSYELVVHLCPTAGASFFRILSPVISENRLLLKH